MNSSGISNFQKYSSAFGIKVTTVDFTTRLRESDNISHQKPRIRVIL